MPTCRARSDRLRNPYHLKTISNQHDIEFRSRHCRVFHIPIPNVVHVNVFWRVTGGITQLGDGENIPSMRAKAAEWVRFRAVNPESRTLPSKLYLAPEKPLGGVLIQWRGWGNE